MSFVISYSKSGCKDTPNLAKKQIIERENMFLDMFSSKKWQIILSFLRNIISLYPTFCYFFQQQ